MIFSQALDDIKQGHELLLPELTKRKAKHEACQEKDSEALVATIITL